MSPFEEAIAEPEGFIKNPKTEEELEWEEIERENFDPDCEWPEFI